MTSKDHALPKTAFVTWQEEQVPFQRLLEVTEVPCRGNEELFFADPEDETELDDVEVASDMCLDCPLMFQCQQFARQSGIEFGVFGGETAAKRNKWLRSQRRKGKR
jgi:hypothetical protein